MRLVTAISMAVVFIVPAAAQSPLPVEKESHHSVVLENAYVRVIDMILQPGEETLDHRHSRDTLQVMVGPSPMSRACELACQTSLNAHTSSLTERPGSARVGMLSSTFHRQT